MTVAGVRVPAGQLADALARNARAEVLQIGAVAFAMVVVAAAVVSWVLGRRLLRPLHDVTAAARRITTPVSRTKTVSRALETARNASNRCGPAPFHSRRNTPSRHDAIEPS